MLAIGSFTAVIDSVSCFQWWAEGHSRPWRHYLQLPQVMFVAPLFVDDDQSYLHEPLSAHKWLGQHASWMRDWPTVIYMYLDAIM